MNLVESEYVKLHVVVPLTHADALREALGTSGAGVQGKYDFCSGSIKQTGRFRPLQGAHPTLGEVGKKEEVEEEIIQTLCHKNILENVIAAVKKIHPYEEPPIDIFVRFEIQ